MKLWVFEEIIKKSIDLENQNEVGWEDGGAWEMHKKTKPKQIIFRDRIEDIKITKQESNAKNIEQDLEIINMIVKQNFF